MEGQRIAPELKPSTPSILNNKVHDISDDYEIPSPISLTSMSALKERIKSHYEICSDYYYSLWGEHIHHGYFQPEDSKETAQVQLIELLLDISKLHNGASVLDVGCGIGGTTRYLAANKACNVTGITISGQQVRLARDLTAKQAGSSGQVMTDGTPPLQLNKGVVQFIELDAEKMGDFFTEAPNRNTFDAVWITEAMSHLPDKKFFFRNVEMLLHPGGKLVVADWFKADGITDEELDADIRPIEDGMLLPPLCTQLEYVQYAKDAGLNVHTEPMDISNEVSKTWDISWSLIQSPALWALAFSHGRDGIAFFQAFRAMRRGYGNGTFRYAVMVFGKGGT